MEVYLLYPMFLMVVLTFVVGFLTVKARFSSVKNGDVSAKYYRLMGGQNVPEIITKTTRNFNNQFEIPTLFYVVCTLYISFGIESFLALVFAWLFTILRIVHSYIHITYNHVMHRMLTFFAAFICVMVLWVNLLLQKI
ncbi:MAPEG family protein [Colwellia sp. MB3u-4]|uniref:MAPEG family protein n=1 Tax=Colwellia sp. MB3u-4 TaxID=2759822 RepID=UPI00287017B2|nr:MAPEG family protein [Colwellia sp. MB3u-4]